MRVAPRLALIAAILAAGGQAFAQTPVEGGGDFAQAPALDPGTYTDSIRLRETLFYAVELGSGQKLRAMATVRSEGDNPTPAIVVLDLTVFNPLRTEANRDSTVMTGPSRLERLGVRGPPVGAGDPAYAQPGAYYLALSMTPYRDEFQDVEYPVELRIEVSGIAAPIAGPTSTPALTPSPEVTMIEDAAPPPPSRWKPSELALFGLIGALGGGFLGAFGASRLRRSRG